MNVQQLREQLADLPDYLEVCVMQRGATVFITEASVEGFRTGPAQPTSTNVVVIR